MIIHFETILHACRHVSVVNTNQPRLLIVSVIKLFVVHV